MYSQKGIKQAQSRGYSAALDPDATCTSHSPYIPMTTDDGVEHAPQSPPASIAVDPADHRDAFLNVNGGDGQIKTFHVLLTGFGVSACPSPPGPVQSPRRTRNEFTSHSPS